MITEEQKWKKRFEKERLIRKEAERILEEKSLELYNINQILENQKLELETIFETAIDGIAILDLQSNFIFFNRAYRIMSGYNKKDLISKNCIELSVPEDKESTKEAMKKALEDGYLHNFEKTCIRKDGKRLTVNMSIALMPDKKRFLISAKDITEAKKREKELQGYINLVDKNIISSSTDIYGNITYASEAFLDISGYTQKELIGKNHNILKHPDMPHDFYKKMWYEINKNGIWTGEIKNLKKNGEYYWVDASIVPTFNDEGIKTGYTSIRQDITSKKMMEKASITDGLTSIYNRRHFNNIMPKLINSYKRRDENISFVIMDIDYFKQYNDKYGHQIGDNALKKVTKTVKSLLSRSDDYFFRLGGEEFGIVFKTNSKEEAQLFANKIRKSIEKLSIEHLGSDVSQYLTVSMGLTYKNANNIKNEEELYKQTDDMLYKAKDSGRNNVYIENKI